ncbi:MAG: transcriptional repressor [Deltaproteobacteria bacterium]|nr:transcriptional repressor [Deltaproteobacteria bacterium]MBW2412949.1 transcriptional repressor [Deltaproteobacteria bacterium]
MAARDDRNRERVRTELNDHLARHGLKHTRQRDIILDAFLASTGHITSEQLYEQVRDRHPEIGAATVYRTLKLLVEAGIASSSTFQEGVTLYEHQPCHHDHLICLGCGDIVEFECEEIEQRQIEIAEENGFRLTRHRLHLFGYCARCQKQGRDARP